MKTRCGPSSSTPPTSMFTWYGALRSAVASSFRMYEHASGTDSFNPAVKWRAAQRSSRLESQQSGSSGADGADEATNADLHEPTAALDTR